MERPTGLILALTVFLASTALAQDEQVTDYDRFRLWNDCQPVSLLAGFEPVEDGEAAGLTVEAIETAVRSRLRAARVYDASAGPHVYVYVHVVGSAFHLSFDFLKRFIDSGSYTLDYAIGWQTGATGTHSYDPGFILGGVSQATDAFIDEYLRVNADACW